ncbi:MAG: M48 family metallopeptidase [Planctomycetaceae bacterium]
MSDKRNSFTKFGFVKAFVLPALLIFLIPVLSFVFFVHATHTFNNRVREAVLAQVRSDQSLSAEDREKAIELFTNVPFSRLVRDENFAEMVTPGMRRDFATFRWMILLSALSIVMSVGVFCLTGVCVLLSLRSAFVQYLSLSAGWHVLRISGAIQTAIQGVLVVALSFWVTALWLERFSVKLIFVAGLLAVLACIAVIFAIFKRIKTEFNVEGEVLGKDQSPAVWEKLLAICEKVGTDPPDQVIVGIDNNFFVTEHPVTVGGQTYRGRTLFVSLALLKELKGAEADAVLAHEMAHFSGQDTVYSRKISPLLSRYQHYLEALHSGGITLPIFYYMLCFRALYEVSLSRLSRKREFRADRIAVETTSPNAFAGALLKIAAYDKYRSTVQEELFKQEQALANANISERIEQGFPQYATAFAADTEIGAVSTAHPFDTHPPLSQRLEAIGHRLDSAETGVLLTARADQAWYRRIDGAEELERRQWHDFEEKFRAYHEQTLPFRFLPETDEERAIVLKSFPEVQIPGKEAVLTIDYEKIAYGNQWPEPVLYPEIKELNVNEGVLYIKYERGKKQTHSIKLKLFDKRKQEVLDTINRYYGRYVAARTSQEQKLRQAEVGAS